MKTAYPAIFIPVEDGFVTHIPDFDVGTQGDTLAEAIEMTRDLIGLMGIDMQDDGKELPHPSNIENIKREKNQIVNYVDIDFAEYRLRNNNRSVRRNVSLPAWLDNEASKAGLNVSAVLQDALKRELNK